MRDIDAIDNGRIMPGQEGILHPMSITSMLMSLRPAFDDDTPGAMDTAFLEASSLAGILLAHKVRHAAARLRADAIVHQAIGARSDPRWIELPRGMNYQGPILEAGGGRRQHPLRGEPIRR